MTEYEKGILNRFDILIKILSVFLKFALDGSSYRSKTTDEIKATASKEKYNDTMCLIKFCLIFCLKIIIK